MRSGHLPTSVYLQQLLFSLLKCREQWGVYKHVHSKYLFLDWTLIYFFYLSFIVLHFYWQSHFTSKRSAGEASRLGFLPYIPQCDGLGNWEPAQCYESTGELTRFLLTRYSGLPEQRKTKQNSCRKMEILYSCSQKGEKWSDLQDGWKIDWMKDSSDSSFGLKIQSMFSCSLLVIFLGGQFRGWSCMMCNAFINEEDDGLECTLSKFVGNTKLRGVDDTLQGRAAMEESYQSCSVSILTTALTCGLLISG